MSLKSQDDARKPRYVEGLVAVKVDSLDPAERYGLFQTARETVREAGGDVAPVGVQRLTEIFGHDIGSFTRVTRFVDIFEVDDPEGAASAFDDNDNVSVTPIHALAFNWHQPISATKPSPIAEPVPFPDLPPGDRTRVIAVVDTGVVSAGALPSWMTSSIIHGQDDIEKLEGDDASHGTFVTSLLRQIAPTHVISMARAADYGDGEAREDSHPEPDPTTELHVADAIHRLIDRHLGRSDVVEALNLSVGGPSRKDLGMATLESALGRWREVFPNAPIFAGAGNSPEPHVIYPAAVAQVRGVAAANRDGDQIVWDSSDAEVPPNPAERPWVDDVAPGSRLIGLGGRGGEYAVQWSGSSFATAVATASHTQGGPYEISDSVAYWPDRAMTYGDVPGLQFD